MRQRRKYKATSWQNRAFHRGSRYWERQPAQAEKGIESWMPTIALLILLGAVALQACAVDHRPEARAKKWTGPGMTQPKGLERDPIATPDREQMLRDAKSFDAIEPQ